MYIFVKTKINLTHIFINIINMNNLYMTLIWKSHPLKINSSMNVSGHKFTFKRQEDPHYPDLENFCF